MIMRTMSPSSSSSFGFWTITFAIITATALQAGIFFLFGFVGAAMKRRASDDGDNQ